MSLIQTRTAQVSNRPCLFSSFISLSLKVVLWLLLRCNTDKMYRFYDVECRYFQCVKNMIDCVSDQVDEQFKYNALLVLISVCILIHSGYSALDHSFMLNFLFLVAYSLQGSHSLVVSLTR